MTDNLSLEERRERLLQMPQDELDDLVHDSKSCEASDINNRGREAQVEYLLETPDNNDLPARVMEVFVRRGWSTDWPSRGVYMHLEVSELIEAFRGKRGDPTKEAADVLITLMGATGAEKIPWQNVVAAAEAILVEMLNKPRYPGEYYTPSSLDDAVRETLGDQNKPASSAAGVSDGKSQNDQT